MGSLWAKIALKVIQNRGWFQSWPKISWQRAKGGDTWEVKLVCDYLYQKSWSPNTSYSKPEKVIFPQNKPNLLKWKNHFIFQNSQFWFFGSLSAGSRSRLKPPSARRVYLFSTHILTEDDHYFLSFHGKMNKEYFSVYQISIFFVCFLELLVKKLLFSLQNW